MSSTELSGKQNLPLTSELSSARGSPTAYRYSPPCKMVHMIRRILQFGRHFYGFNILKPTGVQMPGDLWGPFQVKKSVL
jgi:hypothetical protein